MASFYVWSGAAGAANGTSWANAYTTLNGAFGGKTAGDVFYVAHDHSEASIFGSLTAGAGTAANPLKVICVNRAGSVPPVSADRRTTAQISPNVSFGLLIGGYVHYDGIIFSVTTNTLSLQDTSDRWSRFDNCSFRISAAGAIYIRPGHTTTPGTGSEWNNCTVSFADVLQGIESSAMLRWRNTPSALLGTIPTLLFRTQGTGSDVECTGVDFSAAGSGKTIVAANATSQAQRYVFLDCKLNASVTKAAAPLSHGGRNVDFLRSGATGINYAIYSIRAEGSLTEETTIVRTGGASDGTTPLAWAIQTTATCGFSIPFECPPIAIWNDTTGSARTATVEGVWGAGVVPLNSECFLEVEYLADGSSPRGSFVNDGPADLLTTPTSQTGSSATWGGSTTKFKLEATFTAQQKGWIYARVKCAKASTTFYIDPLVTLT